LFPCTEVRGRRRVFLLSGAGGSGARFLPCGTRLRICNGGACEVAVVEDRGPFVAGRELDLNPGAKAAISCSDLCSVTYGVIG
jgi:hypothetical protein